MRETDEVLLRAVHDEHARPLWRYVVSLTHDASLADDIVQETLVRAWRKPAVLDQSESSARAWLFTVAHNLVIDERRSAHTRHEFAIDELPEPAAVTNDLAEAILDRWLVADALSSLSVEHRSVVVHVYYGGRSIVEVADELHIPEGTVKSRLFYALRALRLSLLSSGR